MEQAQGRRIQPIDRGSVHRIRSGQVVLNLAGAIKELLENSLDAGATSVEVKLKEYGAEAVEVADNGFGVAPEDYQALTLKYHTSKISDFSDLQSLTTFGFRGEALSSLCAMANISILTRAQSQRTATRICYDHTGRITSQECAARSAGTTVYVEKLFSPLPVRHKEFNKNIRREYSRALSTLQAYALIAKNVRLVCTNQVGKNRSNIFVTQGRGSLKDNIATVFGAKTVDCLQPLNTCLSDDVRVQGYISKPGSGSGRPSGDRQYFYLNGRPVEMPKVGKLLNELYRSYNSQQYPMAFLEFQLPTTAFDVNVTPDKRKVLLHAEAELLTSLRNELGSIYAPDKYTFKTQSIAAVLPSASPSADQVHELIDYETLGEVNTAVLTVDVPEADEESEEFSTARLLSSFRRETVGTSAANKQSGSAKKNVAQGSLSGFVLQSKRKGSDVFPVSQRPVLKKHSAAVLETSAPKDATLIKKNDIGGTSSEVLNNDAENVEVKKLRDGQVLALKRPGKPLLTEEPVLKGCMEPRSEQWQTAVKAADAESPVKEIIGEQCDALQQAHLVNCIAVSEANGQEAEQIGYRTDGPASSNQVRPSNEDNGNQNTAEDIIHQSVDGSLDQQGSEMQKSSRQQKTRGFTHHGFDSSASSSQPTRYKTRECTEVSFDMKRLQGLAQRGLLHRSQPTYSRTTRRSFRAATVGTRGNGEAENEETPSAATMELKRSFNKADFKRMKVLGQFNLSFILAKLDDDIFIIDQHASDEKYNFERLSKSTIIHKQPLVRPLPLDLSPVEEVTISTHLETFRRNGFDFVENHDALPGRRLQLSALPFSKDIMFGVPDVQEMVTLLQDNSGTNSVDVRPSRVTAMLASRACRSSIMMGDALSKREMEKVVFRLADLEAPWNCPHGRPTIRHLVDLNQIICR